MRSIGLECVYQNGDSCQHVVLDTTLELWSIERIRNTIIRFPHVRFVSSAATTVPPLPTAHFYANPLRSSASAPTI